MPQLATEHTLIDGHRIAYGIYGTGTPVVLLHGTPSSSYIWRNVVPSLVKAGYKVHVYDLLGFGLSERPSDPDVDTSMTAQVPILEGLLEHWGLETFHLVAHDFGGGIAQRFGIQSIDRLLSLTMIDVVSYDSYPSKCTRKQMQSGLEHLINTPDAEHRTHFRDWLLSAAHNKESLTNDALDVYLGFISGPVGQASLFQHQIRHYDPKHTLDFADRLHELGQVPVKLIWGADDLWQVPDWAHKLHKAILGSSLEILDNCGHFSPEDQPEKIADILKQFLHSHTAKDTAA
ncbi:Soluble epoxide hydrolase [Roseovarius albus]|uniref:Soluble epoxide hydrolase n=1 Tax=Roseovarius albus TaxID=1247867 RepID=A0A1X6Y9M3_9RHOB|nr:alpha/beta hydrolase [Roseovarius albus]SLN14387.1 Soluble epoxide hydrolase [Roseovarius albus]